MTLPTPPLLDRRNSALFLDLDGTLAEIETRPGDVGPVELRTRVLSRLVEAMEGRVAILTGRSLADADRILEGAVPVIGAVHGLVRRLAGGRIVEHPPSGGLPEARRRMQDLAGELGLLVEDKGASFAVHYRLAPDAGERVRLAARRVADETGLVVQDGSMVSELRSTGPHKGDALKAIMADPPFAGHNPVMVGDDLTDEHAFAAAEAAGGYGVLVGAARKTGARFRLGGVGEVLAWLEDGATA